MADAQCSSISYMIEANWSMQAENIISRKDLSNRDVFFLPYLQIKPCSVRHESGKNLSSQHGNSAACLLRSSLLRLVSTLVMFLESEAWLQQVRACMLWSAVM